MGLIPSATLGFFYPSHLYDHNKITLRLEINVSVGNESSCGRKPESWGKSGLFSTVTFFFFPPRGKTGKYGSRRSF